MTPHQIELETKWAGKKKFSEKKQREKLNSAPAARGKGATNVIVVVNSVMEKVGQ